MESSEGPSKKPRIIQRLDFENCVFSGVKTRYKRKRQLRARYFRDVETCDKNVKAESQSSSIALDSPLKTIPAPRNEISPILLTKTFRKKNHDEGSDKRKSSPVFRSQIKTQRKIFRSKRKIIFGSQSPKASTISLVAPKSPVFKSSQFVKKKKLSSYLEKQATADSKNLLERLSNNVVSNEEIKSFEKFEENSYRIEESSQESKQSLHISSVTSSEVKMPNSEICPSDGQIETKIEFPNQENNNDEENEKVEVYGEDSPPARKFYKKSGLLSRLHIILKKQISEKQLWQHHDKKEIHNFERLLFLDYWSANSIFLLKCHTDAPEPKLKYVVVDKKWITNIPALKKGSVLHLYPPWQTIDLSEEKVSVLINVFCLEISEDTSDSMLVDKKTLKSIPPEQFKDSEDDLLNNAFFSSHLSPFLL